MQNDNVSTTYDKHDSLNKADDTFRIIPFHVTARMRMFMVVTPGICYANNSIA